MLLKKKRWKGMQQFELDLSPAVLGTSAQLCKRGLLLTFCSTAYMNKRWAVESWGLSNRWSMFTIFINRATSIFMNHLMTVVGLTMLMTAINSVFWSSYLDRMPKTRASVETLLEDPKTWIVIVVCVIVPAILLDMLITVTPDHYINERWDEIWPFRKRGLIETAAGVAARGKVLVVGIWWLAVGVAVLMFTWNTLPGFLPSADRSANTIILTAGTAIGAYLVLARGLGPAWSALRRTELSTGTHGKARFAKESELREGSLIPRYNGIYLGSYMYKGDVTKQVAYPGRVNLITIGPAGSGKGSGIIVPTLSTSIRSIFIIDPKGEAAAITASKRSWFGPVIVINPFNVLADTHPLLESTGFNPLAGLKVGDDLVDDCASIAQALVRDQSGSDGAFFTGSARDLLTCLIMYEKIERRNKASLSHVRTLLTEPFEIDRETGERFGLAKTVLEMTESSYEPLRAKAGRFKSGTKSNLDIFSTAANETQFLDSPAMQRDLEGRNIDWNSMKSELTTVYLILPADRLETHSNYLRLVVTSALRSLLRTPPGPVLPPVLFMLDEFAQLGYLASIENAMGIARGFGVALWPFLQDLNQLHALYKDRWQTFIGNAEVLTAFAPRDVFTAEYLSKRCGSQTIIVESENERMGMPGAGYGRGPQGVPLLRPEELMAMPARQMLCFVEPIKNPFFTKAPPYSEHSLLSRQLDENPYHR